MKRTEPDTPFTTDEPEAKRCKLTEALSPENALLVKQILARNAHTKEIVASVCERASLHQKYIVPSDCARADLLETVFYTPTFGTVKYGRNGVHGILEVTINRCGISHFLSADKNDALARECKLFVARNCVHFDMEPVCTHRLLPPSSSSPQSNSGTQSTT